MLVFGMLVLVSTIYEGIYQRKKEKSRAEVTSDIPLTSHNSPNTDVANVVDTGNVITFIFRANRSTNSIAYIYS